MNKNRKVMSLLLCAMTLPLTLLTQTSCSSGSDASSETTSFPGVLTKSDLASLTKDVQIYVTGSILLQPLGLVTPVDQIAEKVVVYASLSAVTEDGTTNPVQVLCTYETTGSNSADIPPTSGTMVFDFGSDDGLNDANIIRALGLRETSTLRALSFHFNFQTNVVDILGDASIGSVVQPGEGGTGENTDSELMVTNRPYAIRIKN